QQISNGNPPDEFAPLADVPKIDSFARRIARAPATIDDNIRHALSTQNAILTLESQIREKGVVPVSGHRYVKTAQAAAATQTKSTTCETKSAPQPEIGRNSPCPCGSGNKYKRCCGVNAPPILNNAA
ncbi:MAG: SEC-C domain-containing protein, partial [Bryobacterales bacterium]|nr:SEC-C domain-containing protein [Bryobacterales bacterium]